MERSALQIGQLARVSKRSLRYVWSRILKPVLPVLVGLLCFRSVVADWCDVPTDSMQPTIYIGDRIFVNKLAFGLRVPWMSQWIVRWATPERGEIVALVCPADGLNMTKRIIGLPGDELEVRNGRVCINGRAAEYQSLPSDPSNALNGPGTAGCLLDAETVEGHVHPVLTRPDQPTARNFGPVRVPDGQYFVMGDNRDRSRDSRYYGFVPAESIVGRVTTVVFSIDRGHGYLPRWQRFFRSVSEPLVLPTKASATTTFVRTTDPTATGPDRLPSPLDPIHDPRLSAMLPQDEPEAVAGGTAGWYCVGRRRHEYGPDTGRREPARPDIWRESHF